MTSRFNSVILDIEGTICPVSFVKDTLFPYFLEHLEEYLSKIEFPLGNTTSNLQNAELAGILDKFPTEYSCGKATLEKYIRKLVKNDVKDPVLKELQGYVWKTGYNSGEILAPLYDDAIEAIKHWSVTLSGGLYIYSSGSIEAQKLLLSHVKISKSGHPLNVANLNGLLSGYFDTTNAGSKIQIASYRRILQKIGYGLETESQLKYSSVLFLSDNPAEVEAAIQAGMTSYLVYRAGNREIPHEIQQRVKVITNFAQLF
ncbi:hypothetical protein HII13_000605 [Brettanomyces bruxellensis]|uniref:Enolase-phosphatase E1 n=1 Tax=Dekkera bruxellensis TaxID=5007 RepID=A0A8H6EXS1_DEKBR|nr:hypothetical protein HII12_003366 [Brettanomyces bruxellensis]KAF6014260.1 hypothetical protein HII13_000605 [Brettanomyces bruxellensis]